MARTKVKSNPAALKKITDLKKVLRQLPVTVAESGAAAIAPELTTETQRAFDAGRTVYDAPRPLTPTGQTPTLVRSGETRRRLGFVAIGTQMRAQLGTKYARYLIGAYDILPNGPMPEKWRTFLRQRLSEIVGKEMKERAP